MRSQADDIRAMNGCLHEAHMHALVNMTARRIVVLEQRPDRLCCLLYELGYKAQRELAIEQTRALIAESEPPVFMFLEGKHYSALLPDDKDSKADKVIDVDAVHA